MAAVIESLHSAGLTDLSIRMIHQKLGTGSLTTISRHKRSIEFAHRDNDPTVLPDPVVEQLSGITADLWVELSQAADALTAQNKVAAEKAV